mmetsp:Transcript_52124/g.161476  ORF Transcript_52124/g.161476 Transcript_52124/m.161476 type:complete len:316 (-) Transcript_52124:12-959(-)
MQLCSCSCTKVASKPAASGRQLVEADVVLYRRLSCCWCASGERRRPLGRTSEDVLERLLRISQGVLHKAPDVLRCAAGPVPGSATSVAGPLKRRTSRMLHRLARIAQRIADTLEAAGRLEPDSSQAAQGHASSGRQRDLRACAHAACLRRLGWRLLAVGRLLVPGLAVGRLAVGWLLVRGLGVGWLAVGWLLVQGLAVSWLAVGGLRVRHLPVPRLPVGGLRACMLPIGRWRKRRLRIGGLLQGWGLHVRELRGLRAGRLRKGLQRLEVLLWHLSRAAAAAAHACQRGGGRRAGAAVPPMGTSWAVAQTKVLGQA